MSEIQPFNKETRGKMAACEAVGLEYWSDHPKPGCVWAVDGNQQAHVVRWYKSRREAAIQTVTARETQTGYGPTRVESSVYDAGDRVKVA